MLKALSILLLTPIMIILALVLAIPLLIFLAIAFKFSEEDDSKKPKQ